ncbi:hypothetical protein STEG23_009097, partial [Scotinomys teguina]
IPDRAEDLIMENDEKVLASWVRTIFTSTWRYKRHSTVAVEGYFPGDDREG